VASVVRNGNARDSGVAGGNVGGIADGSLCADDGAAAQTTAASASNAAGALAEATGPGAGAGAGAGASAGVVPPAASRASGKSGVRAGAKGAAKGAVKGTVNDAAALEQSLLASCVTAAIDFAVERGCVITGYASVMSLNPHRQPPASISSLAVTAPADGSLVRNDVISEVARLLAAAHPGVLVQALHGDGERDIGIIRVAGVQVLTVSEFPKWCSAGHQAEPDVWKVPLQHAGRTWAHTTQFVPHVLRALLLERNCGSLVEALDGFIADICVRCPSRLWFVRELLTSLPYPAGSSGYGFNTTNTALYTGAGVGGAAPVNPPMPAPALVHMDALGVMWSAAEMWANSLVTYEVLPERLTIEFDPAEVRAWFVPRDLIAAHAHAVSEWVCEAQRTPLDAFLSCPDPRQVAAFLALPFTGPAPPPSYAAMQAFHLPH
jgi:hypothetical protein